MARIYKTFRPLIADRMAEADVDRIWMAKATFAKTNNGYWLAWQGNEVGLVAFLTPGHPKEKKAQWLDSWDDGDTVETLIAHFESGRIEQAAADSYVLNMQILNKEKGEWE